MLFRSWNLNVPNRVKNLMWRAGSDSLPSKSNLRKRKIPIDTTCSSCGLEMESSLHAIWSCASLVQVWKVHFGWLIKEAGKASCFLDVLQVGFDKSQHMDLFAMIVSLIWTRRNKLRVGEAVTSLALLNQLASTNLLEFQQSSLNQPKSPSHPKVTKWLPPPPN